MKLKKEQYRRNMEDNMNKLGIAGLVASLFVIAGGAGRHGVLEPVRLSGRLWDRGGQAVGG
jgi:hypothetical protein